MSTLYSLPATRCSPSYVELRTHTAFSFGDGSATPEAMVAAASAMGYTALGLTDAADFGGVVRFALAAWDAGITPIIGAELNVDGYPVALLARTAAGCRNLGALITRARSGCLRSWDDGKTSSGGGGGEGGRGGWGRVVSPAVDHEDGLRPGGQGEGVPV